MDVHQDLIDCNKLNRTSTGMEAGLIYPNPCTDEVTLEGFDQMRYSILDLNGFGQNKPVLLMRRQRYL
jgi:hypothetical protein